jgi:hypothetical protein
MAASMPVPMPQRTTEPQPPAPRSAGDQPGSLPVPPGFERYLTPEFTRELLAHLTAARNLALADLAAEGRDGRP